MSQYAPEALLRLCFPNLRVVGTGIHSRSISTPIDAIEKFIPLCDQDRVCYMTLSDYGAVKGAKRKSFPDPRGYFLVLDFDLKHQKIYTDAASLLAKLTEVFADATAIVFSGGGYHVYFCSNEAVRHPEQDLVKQWFMSIRKWLAHSALAIDRRAGLAITDVIRLPGSYHQSLGAHGEIKVLNTQHVYTAAQLHGVIDAYLKQPKVSQSDGEGMQANVPVVDNQLQQIEDERHASHRALWESLPTSQRPTQLASRTHVKLDIWQPMPLDDLRVGCKAFDAFITSSEAGFDNGQRGDRDDVLMACVTLHHTEIPDGSPRQYAAQVLSQWPGGSEEYALEQYDTIVESHGSAPWHCEKWSEHFSNECASCPHKDTQGFSPYRAAKEVLHSRLSQTNAFIEAQSVSVEAANATFGGHYFVGRDQQLWAKLMRKDKDGNDVSDYKPVCRPACLVKFCRFTEEGYVAGVDLANLKGTVVTVPHTGLNESRGRSEYFSKLGIHVVDHTLAGQFLQRCTEFASRRLQFEKFGWHGSNATGWTFVGPGYLVNDKETKPCVLSDGCLNAIDGKPQDVSGELSAWLDAVSVYKRSNQLSYQYFILSSFASVLYELLPNCSGAAVTLVGESGAGKSTAMFAANSVWFKPTATTVTAIDTELGRYGALGVMNNMPVTLNEISHIDPEVLFRLVFSLTEGQGRRGMEKDNTLAARRTWKTALLLTGNKGLMETLGAVAMGNQAAANRAIDLTAPTPDPSWAAEADAAARTMKDHYGVAGQAFIQQLFRMGFDNVRQIWVAYKTQVDDDHPQVDRFLRVHASLVMTVAHLLKSFRWDSFFDKDGVKMFIDAHMGNARLVVKRATEEGTVMPRDVVQDRMGLLIPAETVAASNWAATISPEDKARFYSIPSEQVWADEDYYYFTREYLIRYLRTVNQRDYHRIIENWNTLEVLLTHGPNESRLTTKSLMLFGYDYTGKPTDIRVLVVRRDSVDNEDEEVTEEETH